MQMHLLVKNGFQGLKRIAAEELSNQLSTKKKMMMRNLKKLNQRIFYLVVQVQLVKFFLPVKLKTLFLN